LQVDTEDMATTAQASTNSGSVTGGSAGSRIETNSSALESARKLLEAAKAPSSLVHADAEPEKRSGFAAAVGPEFQYGASNLTRARVLPQDAEALPELQPQSMPSEILAAGFSTAAGRCIQARRGNLARAQELLEDVDADALPGLQQVPESLAAGISTAVGRPVQAMASHRSEVQEPWLLQDQKCDHEQTHNFEVHQPTDDCLGVSPDDDDDDIDDHDDHDDHDDDGVGNLLELLNPEESKQQPETGSDGSGVGRITTWEEDSVKSAGQVAWFGFLFQAFHQRLKSEAEFKDQSTSLLLFDGTWFHRQLRQLVLAQCEQMLEDPPALCTWLLQRCRSETGGRRQCSAFEKLRQDGSIGHRHLVVQLSRFKPQQQATKALEAEITDGRHFMGAQLDGHLSKLALHGKLKAGARLHVTCATVTGVSEASEISKDVTVHVHGGGSCSTGGGILPGAKLLLTVNSCRPCSLRIEQGLGWQRRPFPPVPIAAVVESADDIPLVDVIVLRLLPPVFRSWYDGQMDERSASQEQDYLRRACEEHFAAGEQMLGGEVNHETWHQRELEGKLLELKGRPQLPVLVLDSQAAKAAAASSLSSSSSSSSSSSPSSSSAAAQAATATTDWHLHTAVVMMPFSSLPEEEGLDGQPRVGDRMRISALKAGSTGTKSSDSTGERLRFGRRGPLRLFPTRSTRFRIARAQTARAPAAACGDDATGGLKQGCLPMSLTTDASRWLARLAILPASPRHKYGPPFPMSWIGHFCDLRCCTILHVGDIEAMVAGRGGGCRATFLIYAVYKDIIKEIVPAPSPMVEKLPGGSSAATSGSMSRMSVARLCRVSFEAEAPEESEARRRLSALHQHCLESRPPQELLAARTEQRLIGGAKAKSSARSSAASLSADAGSADVAGSSSPSDWPRQCRLWQRSFRNLTYRGISTSAGVSVVLLSARTTQIEPVATSTSTSTSTMAPAAAAAAPAGSRKGRLSGCTDEEDDAPSSSVSMSASVSMEDLRAAQGQLAQCGIL